VVDARKERMGKPQIAALLRRSSVVVTCRGKTSKRWDLRRDPPPEKQLYEQLLGPTGNLRAPTLRLGRTLLVGFSEEAWAELLG
jgi:arsenate reductase-like glutaredoxin family protein